MAASSSNGTGASSLNHPLAMLAETCKKISTSSAESSSINKTKPKKSPIKIAPAPKYVTITTMKPQVTAVPQKFVVQVIKKSSPDFNNSNARQIFTVPLLSPQKIVSGQSQQSILQTTFTPPRIFGVNTAATNNGVIVVPQGRLLQTPKSFASNDNTTSTEPNLKSNVVLPSSVSIPMSLPGGRITTGLQSTATGAKLSQISALENTPRVTQISMKIPEIDENSADSQELEQILYMNKTSQQDQQVTNEVETTDRQNTTIQITLPPNASLSSLQNILQIAANAAKKYQGDEPQVKGVSTSTSQMEIFNSDILMADDDETLKRIVRNETGSKKRTQCNCPNCAAKESGRYYTGFSSSRDEKHMHICSYLHCRKEFRKTSHLKSHMRTHTGERPYSCQVPKCGRKFTRSDELLRHLRTHTGIKKFQCIYCEKKFTRSDHLKKHSKTHFKNKLKA